MEVIEFHFEGENYRGRIIQDKNNNKLRIAGWKLQTALQPYDFTGTRESGFCNKEAMDIDDTIFFYVEDDILYLNDEELKKELIECNPDFATFL